MCQIKGRQKQTHSGKKGMAVSHVARGETGAAAQGQVDVCGGQDVYREFAKQLWAMTTKSIRELLNRPQIRWRPFSGTLFLWWDQLRRVVAPPQARESTWKECLCNGRLIAAELGKPRQWGRRWDDAQRPDRKGTCERTLGHTGLGDMSHF